MLTGLMHRGQSIYLSAYLRNQKSAGNYLLDSSNLLRLPTTPYKYYSIQGQYFAKGDDTDFDSWVSIPNLPRDPFRHTGKQLFNT